MDFESWPLIAALLVVAGCGTVIPPVVEIRSAATVYISPENGDGIQDRFEMPVSATPAKSRNLTRYRFTITDRNGYVVRETEEFRPDTRFFGKVGIALHLKKPVLFEVP